MTSDELNAARCAVSVAKRMLAGTRDPISGCRELAACGPALSERTELAQAFGFVSGVVSETDHLPIGRLRALWATDSLAEKDRQKAEYLERRGPDVLSACREVVAVLGPHSRGIDDLVIRLEGPDASELVPSVAVPEYDAEMDNVVSLLSDICDALADDGRIRFIVQFAGETWRVDVWLDLLTVVEQMPSVAEAMPGPFEIDFFEQGLERALQFEPVGDEIEVRATSRNLDWDAPRTVVTLDAAALRSELREVVRRFVDLAAAATPGIARHPWFTEWCRATSRI